MKAVIIVALGLSFISSMVGAASNVSPKFDGAYGGVSKLNPIMSRPDCEVFPLEISVKGGFMSNLAPPPTIDGFVTEEGFIHGHLRYAGGWSLLFEGRMAEDMMSAAIIDYAAGCAWSLNLQKK